MATYSHRLASVFPLFGSRQLSVATPDYPIEDIVQETKVIYGPLKPRSEKWLRVILTEYSKSTTRYLFANRATDLAEYAAQLGIALDSLLNLAPEGLPKYEYPKSTKDGAKQAFRAAIEKQTL